jgi:hypothetical protein
MGWQHHHQLDEPRSPRARPGLVGYQPMCRPCHRGVLALGPAPRPRNHRLPWPGSTVGRTRPGGRDGSPGHGTTTEGAPNDHSHAAQSFRQPNTGTPCGTAPSATTVHDPTTLHQPKHQPAQRPRWGGVPRYHGAQRHSPPARYISPRRAKPKNFCPAKTRWQHLFSGVCAGQRCPAAGSGKARKPKTFGFVTGQPGPPTDEWCDSGGCGRGVVVAEVVGAAGVSAAHGGLEVGRGCDLSETLAT